MGILGVYIGQMFLNIALQYITPVNAALVNSSQAALTLLLAAALNIDPLGVHTRAGLVKAAGVAAVTAGAVYSVVGSKPAAGTASPSQPAWHDLLLGNILLLVQCTSGALFQLTQKHVLSLPAAYPPAAVAGFSYAVGGVAVALVVPVCKLDAAAWHFSPSAGWCLLYSIVLTSATSYAALAWANKHSSPALVTAFFPLQMVFTAFFQFSFLGVSPTAAQVAGGGVIILGLLAATAGQVMAPARGQTRGRSS
jgi:drug/metabolite transporter (DMT)-like permease